MPSLFHMGLYVLIETLWNVKMVWSVISTAFQVVLIETLWNVKLYQKSFYGKAKVGFNRNIVECKAVSAAFIKAGAVVLIETLWNVKTVVGVENASAVGVLIETLWNVKHNTRLPR